MSDTLQIGPFAVPLLIPVMIAAVILGAVTGIRIARKTDVDVDQALLRALLAGVVAARLAHLWEFRSAYLAYPLSVLDLGDGGWDLPFGFAIAWVFALAKSRSLPAQRKPIVAALGVASSVWLLGSVVPIFYPDSGATLPALSLPSLEGGTAVLSGWKGQPTAVNLWATWCPSCQHEMPVLQQAQADYPEVNFVFANQGESAEHVKAYLASQHLSLHNVLLDSSGQLARQFAEQALPATLFFDGEGRLVSRRIGGLTPSILVQRLGSIESKSSHK